MDSPQFLVPIRVQALVIDEDVTERNLAYIDNPEGNGRDWIAAILERGTRPLPICEYSFEVARRRVGVRGGSGRREVDYPCPEFVEGRR